ncbi:predicted protein [Micromonas commoda]|uniref:Smr domain-containing protein n=1 Tax=Micromonas commoda (strain RCC299 / NOUM17 / CCMP2709) TaxID=296587 RepID=C1EIF1_MICCC|nr:predicted protein [Micromonas commoda]ACO67671.1 predicted protein [Micromonas commoda]|eukprot:XP_002506413.1 predicted protein [Micromonas commoda]
MANGKTPERDRAVISKCSVAIAGHTTRPLPCLFHHVALLRIGIGRCGSAADMSAALRVATVTPRALPHRAASGATAGPSRDPHPRWARLGPRRRATPPLPESTRRLSAERTRATARASTTDESSQRSGGEARQNTTDGVARIARREALARVEASLNRNDDWRQVLAVIEGASRASGVPPARCVRTTRLWGHAGARWDLPAVLAVLRALDGADFAACVRAVGEKGGARDALEVYKEGIKAGYHRDDGGASRAAMAWVHDGIGQGKQADALWVDMHAEAKLGRVDVAKCARVAAGLNNWNRGVRRRKDQSPPPDAASCADDDGLTNHRSMESIVEEVYALEIASKARRRPRAAADAYESLRDYIRRKNREDPSGDTSGAKNSSLRSRSLPTRVYTAACRAASALRDPRFARNVAVDIVGDGDCVADDYMVASLAPVIGASGTAAAADAVEALFQSARRGRHHAWGAEGADGGADGYDDGHDGHNSLGGAAWSCVIGALCRAGRTTRASELLDEMASEPFMRRWPSCPTPGGAMPVHATTGGGGARSSIFDLSVGADEKNDGDEAAAAWAADAKRARRAAAQRRAAAPAYAQLMHALLASRSSRRGARAALDVHAKMAAHGVVAPENPRHYRALYKAMLRGGGAGGRRMSPMQAAASCVADAVVRSEHLELTTGSSSNVVKSRAASAARASLHVAAVAGLPDVSSRTLENLRAAGVAPVPEDLELTLEAFERAGDAAGAVALWEANLAALDQLKRESESVHGGREGREGRDKGAYDARRVGLGGLGCEPTRRAWTSIIKAYCDAGEPVGAARLLEDAVRSARAVISADSRAAGKKTKKAKNGKANGTVGRRKNGATAGVELVAFNLVASAFSRANEPRRAEAILRAMLDDPHGDGVVPKPDRATFNTVIDAYAAVARPKRSTESQTHAQPTRSQLNEDSNTELNGDGFDDRYDERYDDDRYDDRYDDDRYDDRYDDDSEDACDAASRLLREMRSPKVRLEPCLKTWTSVLSACARAGAPDRASEVFDRMRAAGVTPDAKAWTALMQAHACAGDLHATADAYWRMRTEGVAPNEGTLGAALAAGRVGGGDVGALIAIYRDMRALDVRPNNRGFRQLTEMWVDQAFEPASGGASSGSVQSSHPSHVVHPNFMLADVLGPEVDGPAESIASHESAVVSRDASDLSGSMSDSPMNSPMIDVHGLSVPETRAAVLSVLQALRERRKLGLAVHGNLVIVTGVGKRSPSEPPLRDAVVKLAGDLKLSVDVADDNPGRLVAREATLLAWLDRDRNETWSKERELVASVRVPRGKSSKSSSESRGFRVGANRSSRRSGAGGKAGGGGGAGRRYVGRRGRGAPRPTPTTGGLDSALRQWLDENDGD